MNVLILGGTRFIGRHVAETLVAAGASVTLFHRGVSGSEVPGTTSLHGDRSSVDGLTSVRQLRPDVVVDLSSYASAWTRLALDAFAGRTGHYVYVSSGAVYRPMPELPWPETTPFGPMPLWGQYGHEKVTSELMLWDAHRRGAVAVTVFRLPFVLGPGNYVDRESFVLSRIEAGRPILLPGGGQAINQFVHVADAARAFVAAVMQPDTSSGQAYNCAFRRGLTNRGFVDLCAESLGLEADVVPIDDGALGVESAVVNLSDLVFPFPEHHYLLDTAKIVRELGVEAHVSNRRMIEEYVSWWRTQEDHTPRQYEREDRALRALAE